MTTTTTAGVDLDKLEALALAYAYENGEHWYGLPQIADGITYEPAANFITDVSPATMLELIALARRSSTAGAGADERVPGIEHPTTYADLARITPEQLWNRWYPRDRSVSAREAFIAARTIPQARAAQAQPAIQQQIMLPLSSGLPDPGEHLRVLVYTDGVDFNGDQYFDISAEDLWEPDPDMRTEIADAATHWMPLPRPGVAAPVSALPAGSGGAKSFDAWFDREYPMVNGRRPKFQERSALALMGEAWDAALAQQSAGQQAAASIDTPEFRALLRDVQALFIGNDTEAKAELVKHINAWGAAIAQPSADAQGDERAADEEGWPTSAMIQAGWKAGLSGKIGSGFRAMLAAAPAAPAAPQGDAVKLLRSLLEAYHTSDAAVAREIAKARAFFAAPAALHQQDGAQGDAYGSTDFGYTLAGIHMEEGDKRLMSLLVSAFGTNHPAIDDMTALLFRVRAAPAAQQAGAQPVASADALAPEHLAVIEEAAQVLESAAAHNRAKGRTVLERTQQDRANRLRAVLAAMAAPSTSTKGGA